MRLSTAPVWNDGQLVPRPFVLRVFATATPDGWHVMSGGFCRISARPDARAVSMGEGVQSADVWVLSSKPVVMETLLPATDDVRIRRILGNLPSRAADNLFWYGRYLERAEATLRVVRCLCARSLDMDLSSGDMSKSLAHLAHQLVAWGAVDEENEDSPIARHCPAGAVRRRCLRLRTFGRSFGAQCRVHHSRTHLGRCLEAFAPARHPAIGPG